MPAATHDELKQLPFSGAVFVSPADFETAACPLSGRPRSLGKASTSS